METFRVVNNGAVNVPLHDENGVRHLVVPGGHIDFSTRHAAEAAANDYNASTLSPVKLEVTVVVTDEFVADPTEKEDSVNIPVASTPKPASILAKDDDDLS